MARSAAHIRRRDNCGRYDLVLDCEVVVGVVRHLEGRYSGRPKQVGSVIRSTRNRQRAIEAGVVDGHRLNLRRIVEGALFEDAVQNTIVEDAEAATYRGQA